MSVQVRRRREAAAFLASFVGAGGELLVDTTNNRVQVHDGVTPGGFPAAKLADVAQRTAVADANYAALATDRTVAFMALTAARTVTLPPAAAYPTGLRLLVLDETGLASPTITVTLAAAGTDLIGGAGTAVITVPYGLLALQSNGASRWTIVDRAINKAPTQTVLLVAQGSGTYTTPPGASWLRVRMVGGGGGGAGSGGSPGAGAAGGTTTFGALSAAGGGGATAAAGSPQTAAPTTGDINLPGNAGADAMTGVAGMTFPGGFGGASSLGGGGFSRVNGTGRNGVTNSGAGGGGGGCAGATTAGGGGAAGGYIEKIIAGPAGSYAFTVGAAGAGGAAGTSGFIGGNGAGGIIIVEEHFD